MLLALILVPTLAGFAMPLLRATLLRRVLLVATAVSHAAMTGFVALRWPDRPESILHGWLALDAMGMLFLGITSVLFLAAAVYAVGYLDREAHDDPKEEFVEHTWFTNQPEALFLACLLLFLGAMTAVTVSQHLGLIWVAVEATTLFSAPLIYFHKHHRSLEATWKYVLICSVGIALALLGNFALAAALPRGGGEASLVLHEILEKAAALNPMWVKTAMLFLIVGYGTKMGLAPMHTWLPDAHSEAPSMVSALLSGALLNCAFLGILRGHQVCLGAGLGDFSRDLLVGFGLVSLAVAAVFIVGQTDFKRLLAYSSVEHMGILALAAGLGGAYGMGLHAVNHSLTKGCLFLIAGNVLSVYQTKTIANVRGVLRRIPLSGVIWFAGFLAITGSPPFGVFFSEFSILRTAMDAHRGWVAAAFLGLLAIIFLGMSWLVLPMLQGRDDAKTADQAAGHHSPRPLTWWMLAPPAVLILLVLALGLTVPTQLDSLLHEIAHALARKGAA